MRPTRDNPGGLLTAMRRTGYTLMEVILVLAIMVLLAALSFPSVETMYGDVRLNAAADQIRARWADARTQAIEEGRPYRFAVQTDGRFRIAPDTMEFWGGGSTGDNALPNETDTPPLDIEESLPKGVKFSDNGLNTAGDAGDAGGWITVVRFQPDGTASTDVEIVFESEGCRPLQLRLRGLTGAVTATTLTTGVPR
jgi:prepilin-type N-terminal cleavage/methylation domain-containing protein